jgi:hypothetical protein
MTEWTSRAQKASEASTPWVELTSASRAAVRPYLIGLGATLIGMAGAIIFLLFFKRPFESWAVALITAGSTVMAALLMGLVIRRENIEMRTAVSKAEELAMRLGDVRESEELVTAEKRRTRVEGELFELNRSRAFTLMSLELTGTRYFADCDWTFSSNLSLLLGRNGYGKTYVLQSIAALLSCNFGAMERMFEDDDARIELTIGYAPIRSDTDAPTQTAPVSFSDAGIISRIGPVPVLAIPGLRFIDKSSSSFGPGPSENLVRQGAALFVDDRPIVGLVETMI